MDATSATQLVSTTLPSILSLIQQLSESRGLALPGVVTKLIDVVAPFVPLAIKEVHTMGPVLRNIISGLRGGTVVDEDWAKLQSFEDQLDAAWAKVRGR